MRSKPSLTAFYNPFHRSDKCDGTPDCDDGSDEEDCPSINCKDTEFRCSDHECILKRWVCGNGIMLLNLQSTPS